MREEKKVVPAAAAGPMPLGGFPVCGCLSCVARQCSLAHATSQMSPVAQGNAEDAARMDWLEQQVRQSRTGVSFDYGRSVDGGLVTEKGYRFMKHHLLCDRMPTLRAAIDAARTQAQEGCAA